MLFAHMQAIYELHLIQVGCCMPACSGPRGPHSLGCMPLSHTADTSCHIEPMMEYFSTTAAPHHTHLTPSR